MAIEKRVEWIVDHAFNQSRCRHQLNKMFSVMHCHHYATLTCQLADDADEKFNGRAILRQACELAFHKMLAQYYRDHQVESLADRLTLAQDYWRFSGMGLVAFEHIGPNAATIRMDHSHVDEGWIKRWGKLERPINFFGQGFVAAVMATIYDLPPGSFSVRESESIVAGAEASRFIVVRA